MQVAVERWHDEMQAHWPPVAALPQRGDQGWVGRGLVGDD
jgi:hypothetical protein